MDHISIESLAIKKPGCLNMEYTMGIIIIPTWQLEGQFANKPLLQ